MFEVPERKTKAKRAQGWEEAGGEFYQENYSTEWDRIPKNNLSITTLLPSKQNRSGTNTRTQKRDLKNSKYWQTYASTTQKLNKHNDVQFSQLPDLSQVINDEGRIWEEMLKIKLLPVSMQQKKDLKTNLQSATKLKLQGLNQYKWKHRKACQKFSLKWSEFLSKLELWHSSLKHIEGHFGTGVVAYFLFLRFLFFLNCATFFIIFIFIILPNLLMQDEENNKKECVTFTDSNTTTCLQISSQDNIPQDNLMDIFDMFRGEGMLQKTLTFYGAYSNKILGIQQLNEYANHSQIEARSIIYYDLPLAYLMVAISYFIIALIAIVRTSVRVFKHQLISRKWQFYQYCNFVFGSWDFCIYSENSATIKHKAVHNEIKCLLQSKRIEIERNNRSKNDTYKLFLTRVIINITVLAILLLAAYFIYFLINISLKQQHIIIASAQPAQQQNKIWNSNHTTSTRRDTELLIQNIKSNQVEDSNQILIYLYDYFPYIGIVCLNLFLPTIFNYLCKFEKYSPLYVVKISLFRTIFLRLASIAILLSRFYYIVIPRFRGNVSESLSSSSSSSPSSSSTSSNCWETFVGQQFFKLIITDFLSHLIVTFCINFPRSLCARNVKNNFLKFIGEQEFELSKHILDIVYAQTICWLGSFYTPFLPAFVAILIFFMFYIKKFQCLVNSKPSTILYGTSRSNSLFMVILLVSYFVAVVPVIYAVIEITPSTTCGPFSGLNSVLDVTDAIFMHIPTFLKNFILFFSTAGFAIPCFFTLTLLLYYFYAVSDANKNMIEILKNQLVLEGHDKQFLLTRLGDFLKQQQDFQENNVNAKQIY